MNRLGMFAIACCCALVGLTAAPAFSLLLAHEPFLAGFVVPALLGVGLLGLWSLWWQGERGTIAAGVSFALLVDALWLMQPMNLT